MLKLAIGNGIEILANDLLLPDIVNIVRNREHGISRQMMVLALAKTTDPVAIPILVELLSDDEVSGHAVIALRKLKASSALPHLQRLLNHKTSWIRREATKAIKKIEKHSQSK